MSDLDDVSPTSMADSTLRAFKEMAEKKPLAIKRSADGKSVEMAEPTIDEGDLIDFSWPFIWWADPNLIFWNGSELILLLADGPVCFRMYDFDVEQQRYHGWRVW